MRWHLCPTHGFLSPITINRGGVACRCQTKFKELTLKTSKSYMINILSFPRKKVNRKIMGYEPSSISICAYSPRFFACSWFVPCGVLQVIKNKTSHLALLLDLSDWLFTCIFLLSRVGQKWKSTPNQATSSVPIGCFSTSITTDKFFRASLSVCALFVSN